MMNQLFNTTYVPRMFLILCLSACPAKMSCAQSENELLHENQQKATRIQDLEEELEAALARVEDLERRVAQLEELIGEVYGDNSNSLSHDDESPLPEETVSIDESIPNASPRALLAALTSSYKTVMNDVEIGETGDPTRRTYLRKLRGWASSVEREFRSQITWHVRVVELESDSRFQLVRNRAITLEAVDPKTNVVLSKPFTVVLTRLVADRLATEISNFEAGQLILKGVLVPQINITEERLTRGSFDNPSFIGPFAEFGFSIDARTLLPVTTDEQN